uniref:protein-serine/threonine phosphatase n=1 Tax=Nelumbo nucifera TaxID=4432 RepID=A0A822Z023_NELNU|nr:TPA_asm: hypothetical protein HUJ06_008751 [Nelumbo nucifera]
MMTIEGTMDRAVLDDIIRRLLEGRGGKQVQLSEVEIRQLCVNARHVFISQPNLLQLHAPIKICGLLLSLVSVPFLSIWGIRGRIQFDLFASFIIFSCFFFLLLRIKGNWFYLSINNCLKN